METIQFRSGVLETDQDAVLQIVKSSGFFNNEEQDVAVELVTERLEKGESSGYYFIFAELEDKVVGYSCFGPIPGTASSYDLYWIAVDDSYRGRNIGRQIIEKSEQRIAEMGGTRIYVETSSRAQYKPTRHFYLRCHYILEAELKDFYAKGDSKCIFIKILNEDS